MLYKVETTEENTAVKQIAEYGSMKKRDCHSKTLHQPTKSLRIVGASHPDSKIGDQKENYR